VSGPSIKPADAHAKALAGELVLVDVRTPNEWLETGIPSSAHSITMHQDPNKFLAEVMDKLGGDKSKPLAIICRTGARTTMLQGQLLQIGFSNVLNVTEGMLGGFAGPGWRKAGLPTRMPGEPVETGAKPAKA
jgi:rhodanese-related sulfurtransferase